MSIRNGQTSDIGKIYYVTADTPLNKSLETPLTDFVEPEVTVISVENYESKQVALRVTPPKKAFERIRLGSVYLTVAFDNLTK